MKKSILVLGFITLACITEAQNLYKVIPYPNKLVAEEGVFEFKGCLSITFPVEFEPEIELMMTVFGDEYHVIISPSDNARLVIKLQEHLGLEAYKMSVNRERIVVEAGSGAGCFWAFQTLRQLMTLTGNGLTPSLHAVSMIALAYPWRGFMLDESRNFKGKEAVKILLDQMALLKMNVFHWHLTDDQGWRIEIKKYPLLTDIGAWRDSTHITTDETGWTGYNYDPYPHGGYYTQTEIKDLVSYAVRRHITIVPEIDLPGHSMAAIAAYPWLGTIGDSIRVRSSVGDITPGTLNIADERVFRFIKDVCEELFALFPGNVYHIGGDEADYGPWKNSEAAKTLMNKEAIHNYSDLQMYFSNRLAGFLQENGRHMMGWNEIFGENIHTSLWDEADATQSLEKNVIVHFWAGDPAQMKEAMEKGYDVVNSDRHFTYLNYPHSFISLEKAYGFSPTPVDVSQELAGHLLGLEFPVWGERLYTRADLYQRVFPRLAAAAEVGWTMESNKDFERFEQSLDGLIRIWDFKGILYFQDK